MKKSRCTEEQIIGISREAIQFAVPGFQSRQHCERVSWKDVLVKHSNCRTRFRTPIWLDERIGLLSPTWNHAQANRRTSAGFSGPPDEERPSSLAVRQPACELSIPFAVLVQARRKQRGARG